MPVTDLGRFTFTKSEHVQAHAEIRSLFQEGRRVACNGAKLFYKPNSLAYNRIAFTFPRKFGNAVQRNRAKRVGREAYRLAKYSIKSGYDMVLLVYPGTDTLSYRSWQLNKLFVRADLLSDTSGVS